MTIDNVPLEEIVNHGPGWHARHRYHTETGRIGRGHIVLNPTIEVVNEGCGVEPGVVHTHTRANMTATEWATLTEDNNDT